MTQLSGASVPFVILDVFADGAFVGNPLAVVLDADGLTGAQMQLLAREFGFSETAFPLPPEDGEAADYRLRIFTPDVELPFAGHPSVGTAWYLAQVGRVRTGRVVQQCGVGLLPIEVTAEEATLTGGPASVSEPVEPAPALTAVGLDTADLVDDEVCIASTGLPFAVLFVRPESLGRCEPDLQLLRSAFRHPHQGTGVYVVAWDPGERRARARMFAGDIGAPEDPATGSAALALGARLVAGGAFGDGTHAFTVEQGVDMGRPSLLTVTCDVRDGRPERLQVTGGSVLIAEGRIAVPDG